MSDVETTILALRHKVNAFVRARDWESFHNPKDLAAAITIEAAELLELFLWKTPLQVDEVAQEQPHRRNIEDELADIVILCLSLANRLNIDVADAVTAKVAVNESRYPAQLVRGKADKYTAYTDEM